jgi:hypothetical protein
MPTKLIINCETKAIDEVELTDEEIAQAEADGKAYAAEQKRLAKEQAAKEAARQAVLEKLGLTAEEVAALLA